jgi:YD repeat-containing protein
MCPAVSNPINPAVGNKFQIEEDIVGAKDTLPLSFIRTYNSSISVKTTLGVGWRHNYERFVSWLPSGAVEVMRPDGKIYTFTNSGTSYTAPDTNDTLLAINYGTSWKYVTTDNQIEIYNSNGNLTSITDSSGLTQTLVYNTSTLLLSKITDSYGRSLNFSYDTNNRLSTITNPSGGQYTYTYDTNNNLASVIYPDQTERKYLYGESAYTSGISLPSALTGIVDENNNRFATYTYDASGRANSTQHAGGADLFQLSYDANSTQVTDPLGSSRTYHFQTILGVVKSKGQSQPGGSGCGASASALTYDSNGNVASRTDFNGNRTNYAYDLTRNLETSRTEGLTTTGATTSATRTITSAWHPTLRLPTQITNANQQTTYTYNSQGDITQKTITDTSANTARSWNTTYTYSATVVPGVLLQKVEDGPRTDVSDLTTYDYYPADAACAGGHLGCRGQLKQITDALGHVTQLTRYSANGQLEQLTDPNGLVMKMTYDLRQRLTSLDAGGETTTYSYDPAGQLTRVTRPDGAYLAYSYDDAHRLIKTQDDQGNTLSYILDAMGNRTKEEAHDPGGQLARSQSRVYDALSRLQNLVLPQ